MALKFCCPHCHLEIAMMVVLPEPESVAKPEQQESPSGSEQPSEQPPLLVPGYGPANGDDTSISNNTSMSKPTPWDRPLRSGTRSAMLGPDSQHPLEATSVSSCPALTRTSSSGGLESKPELPGTSVSSRPALTWTLSTDCLESKPVLPGKIVAMRTTSGGIAHRTLYTSEGEEHLGDTLIDDGDSLNEEWFNDGIVEESIAIASEVDDCRTSLEALSVGQDGEHESTHQAHSDDTDDPHDDSKCTSQSAVRHDQYELGSWWDVPLYELGSMWDVPQPVHKRQKLGQTAIDVE